MKQQLEGASAVLALLVMLGMLVLATVNIAFVVYGLYLAFSASIILGILVFILEPAPWVLGVLGFFGHPEIAKRITEWLSLPL